MNYICNKKQIGKLQILKGNKINKIKKLIFKNKYNTITKETLISNNFLEQNSCTVSKFMKRYKIYSSELGITLSRKHQGKYTHYCLHVDRLVVLLLTFTCETTYEILNLNW